MSDQNQPFPLDDEAAAKLLRHLPHVEEFLHMIGVQSSDCTFLALYQRVAEFVQKKAATTTPPPVAPKRWEDPLIETLIKPYDSILDLGCGEGDLLARLSYQHQVTLQGVDRDEESVLRCIERGMPVCQEDLERFLEVLPDQSYTFAVLEKTLQTLQAPLKTLRQMLRVARWGIVSFPNFAHWSVRLAFCLGGRMPVTKSLPYNWYDTPNIHLCSVTDFLDWAEQDQINIVKAWVLVEGKVQEYVIGKQEFNISAEQVMFVIERKDYPYPERGRRRKPRRKQPPQPSQKPNL